MAVEKNFTAVKYEAGDLILTKGQQGDKLAYIMDGSVEILQTQKGSDELMVVATFSALLSLKNN